MSKIKLSLVLNTRITLFLREGLKNHERKALITISPLLPANHKITLVCFGIASAVSMTFVCLGIEKLECQISLGISFLSLICLYMICLKEKYAKKNQKQNDQKYFKNDCKRVF